MKRQARTAPLPDRDLPAAQAAAGARMQDQAQFAGASRSRRVLALFAVAGLCLLGANALAPGAKAQSNRLATYGSPVGEQGEVPAILSREDRQYYKDIFAAIDGERWDEVENLLNRREAGLLHLVARAEYYTHARSPKVSAEQVADWFARGGAMLPQAEQLARLGARRGLTQFPPLPAAQPLARQPGAPRRTRPATIDDGTMPPDIREAILDRIKNDDPDGARVLLDGIDALLSPAARAEWRQRVAWSYYIENQDAPALAMAHTVREGEGPWVAEGEWVAGLAAWRLGDCELAASGFSRAARLASNPELESAAHYWANRALVRCRKPGEAIEHLRAAARLDETLYGMLALEQLGQSLPAVDDDERFSGADWKRFADEENVRIAIALIEIGRDSLADEMLRHQARIGSPRDFPALARLARELGLPSSQLWMAHNTPRGVRPLRSLRYPRARWQPVTGWRVDPALAYAHALQESNFRPDAVSPADARGLMQIMPGTARQHATRLNMDARYVDLDDPGVNLALGQRNLEMLRDSPVTRGQLPKIIAAYNAGLTPVGRWESEIRDSGDPLLYMESIPYWETRGYVAIVLRNYWMYQREAQVPSPSRLALAQGQWPQFPQAGAMAAR